MKAIDEISGNAQYDAATANWGSSWRTPTPEDFLELARHCACTKITLNDFEGYKITGPNGKSIFLPAAGWRTNDHIKDKFMGYYMSSRYNYFTEKSIMKRMDEIGKDISEITKRIEDVAAAIQDVNQGDFKDATQDELDDLNVKFKRNLADLKQELDDKLEENETFHEIVKEIERDVAHGTVLREMGITLFVITHKVYDENSFQTRSKIEGFDMGNPFKQICKKIFMRRNKGYYIENPFVNETLGYGVSVRPVSE